MPKKRAEDWFTSSSPGKSTNMDMAACSYYAHDVISLERKHHAMQRLCIDNADCGTTGLRGVRLGRQEKDPNRYTRRVDDLVANEGI